MTLSPWAWLVGAVGKSFARFIAVAIAVLALIAPLWVCWHLGWTSRDEQAQRQALQLRVDTLQQLVDFTDLMARATGDYVLARGQSQIIYRTLRKEVPRVTTIYLPAPGAPVQALPGCVFTRGFVGVWDAALEGTLRDPAAASGAEIGDPAADPVAAADLLDAGITQGEVLDNHIANAERAAELTRQLQLALAYIHNLQRLR